VANGNTSPPPYQSTRYLEIPNRNYSLKNVGTGQYLGKYDIPKRLGFFSNARSISLIYTGVGGECMFSIQGTSDVYFERSANSLIPGNNSAATQNKWALIRESVPNKPYYVYYICASNDSELVLSGDTMKDANRNDLLIISKKRIGDTKQHWKFDGM